MKKVLCALIVTFVVLLTSSCLNVVAGEPKIVTDAKSALNYYVSRSASNPEDFKVVALDTAVVNDSLCILNVQYVTENDRGGHVNAKGQYVYLLNNGIKKNFFVDGINLMYDVTKLYILDDVITAPIRYVKSPTDLEPPAIMVGANEYFNKYVYGRKKLSHADSLFVCVCILADVYADLGNVPQLDNVDLSKVQPIKVIDLMQN